MLLGLHQTQRRFSKHGERALCAAYQAREVERASLLIEYVPQRVAGRVLAHRGARSLDLIPILFYQFAGVAVDRGLEARLALLERDLCEGKRFQCRLRAIRKDDLELLDVILGLAVAEREFATGVVIDDAAHGTELA